MAFTNFSHRTSALFFSWNIDVAVLIAGIAWRSGQRFDKVDQTHLVQGCGKPVQQKTSHYLPIRDFVFRKGSTILRCSYDSSCYCWQQGVS